MNLDQLYSIYCDTPSAINEHLPTLERYASECKHVTELGVQGGISTAALIHGRPGMVKSYDIQFDLRLLKLTDCFDLSCANGSCAKYYNSWCTWHYYIGNSLHTPLTPTDLLFIDTLHTYIQLREELALHHSKVKKWIILHDTESFGEYSEGWQDISNPSVEQKQGLTVAIREFLIRHEKEWDVKEHFTNNNGLTVLERKQ